MLSAENQRLTTDDGIPAFIKMNMKRERDFQCIGLLVMVCWYMPNFEPAIPAKLNHFIAMPETPEPPFVEHIQEVLAEFQKLVSEEEYMTIIQSKWPVLAPIEFVYIGALISRVCMPVGRELASTIYKFRSHCRSVHTDIRLNQNVSKTMFNYIETLPLGTGLRGAEAGNRASGSRKRRRGGDDDSDGEYRPGRDG